MSVYTMAQIVALTGVKAHTLRKWETRYNFLEPERTDTNIRYYSDKQLKKLMNIGILTRNGYRISKIDKMSDEEIHKHIATTLIESSEEDDISALIISALEMDEVTFDSILKEQIVKRGLLQTTTQIIYPFLNQIGVLWGINKVMPAQEHFVSNLIKKKMFAAIDALPYPKEDAPVILMFLTENEHHEIGLLLAYYMARDLGWKVYYLGQNVPTENIQQVIDIVKPNAMLSMFITPTQESIKTKLDAILEQTNLPYWVSGNPAVIEDVMEDDRIGFISKPDDLILKLKQID
ncbi:MAG: MerR family transcriptional regulator [Xanthomarina sp.]|uniref:MerR family transcriptional regulator n=1 Tax=Xanthomarina sp. TaxID=1931211 RepID=UPI000C469AAC|nr:MerR family transcriptional regulator [Xanthomarina sp.]MBF62382.1 MerR family transcriptional regulator [Xanthomarina sp.]MCB0388087.1 MerR family transcriptional regulator [Winogradskyella sp.]HAI17027.1 MerR family transcriptional regulator [Xanthomarina gelatinilytica]